MIKRIKRVSIWVFFLGLLFFPLPHSQIYLAKSETEINSSITLILSGKGYDETIEGENKDSGDFWFPNITISANSSIGQTSITGFKSEMGIVHDIVYGTSPFFSFQSNPLSHMKWWPYWINVTHLKRSFINRSFDVFLNYSTVQPLTYGYNSPSSQWDWNFSAIISLPLDLKTTHNNDEEWIIMGENNETSLEGQLTNRKLVLKYDKEGILVKTQGNSFFQRENNSYEYGFVWDTVEFVNKSNVIPQPSIWDSLLLPSNVLFGCIILGIILLIPFVRAKKS